MFNVNDTRKLFDAARNNELETVKLFIEKQNASITITNKLRQNLAHVAAKHGNLEIVRYVARKMPTILSKTDKRDFTVLRRAVKGGALDVVKYLIENHESDLIKVSDRDVVCNALHTAVQFGHLNIVKYLIEQRNLDVNTLGEWMNQPLVFSAVKYQQEDIIKYLVQEKNVDVTLLDARKENILYITVKTGDLDYMKYLLEQKSAPFDMNWRNEYGETLLSKAVSLNRTNIVKYLVETKHVDVNIATYWDEITPLHCAAMQNNLPMCQYLIEHEAKIDIKDKLGETPAQKSRDRNLTDYFRKVSALGTKRFRRWVQPPFQAKLEGLQESAIGGNPRLVEGPLNLNCLSLYSPQIQNIFIMAGLLTKTAKYSGFRKRVPSHGMDPVALDAVHDNYS